MSSAAFYVVSLNVPSTPSSGTVSIIASFDQSIVSQGWFASYDANGIVAGNAIQTQFGIALPAGSNGLAMAGITAVSSLGGTLSPSAAFPEPIELILDTGSGSPEVIATLPANSSSPVPIAWNPPTAGPGYAMQDIETRAKKQRSRA